MHKTGISQQSEPNLYVCGLCYGKDKIIISNWPVVMWKKSISNAARRWPAKYRQQTTTHS